MAIVKIIAIRDRLDKRVNYAINGEKTTLDAGITYAVNSEKTKQHFFASAINCESCETAYAEMQETKRCFGKASGVVGYHFIQSFAPGEVTPEQAHRIGMAFAEKLFGGQYEAVIGTHLDKAHLHNHIVVNSVSFVDGRKYHSSPGSYYFDVRGASDALCRENGLSVIAPQGKGKHYAEWKAENTGKPTIRSIIRADIDRVIENAYTFDIFLMLLRRLGYVVQNQPNRKYVTVLPPDGKRAIRLDMSLSGGQKQRVAIASAIASDKQVIVFDEPTSGLDYRHMKKVAENLRELSSLGKTLFIVTHDPELIAECCNYFVFIENGKVLWSDGWNRISRERLQRFFAFEGD